VYFYYLLDSSSPILYRTNARGLSATVYEWYDFKARKWTSDPFGNGKTNLLADDFERGSHGFTGISEADAARLIG
jgi:hypothetical protein